MPRALVWGWLPVLPEGPRLPLTPCGSQKVMHTRKRHSELYHELNQKFHTFDRYRSQSTAKVRVLPGAALPEAQGPSWCGGPGGRTLTRSPRHRGRSAGSLSSGGAAARTLSSLSPPGLAGGAWALSTSPAWTDAACLSKGLPMPEATVLGWHGDREP